MELESLDSFTSVPNKSELATDSFISNEPKLPDAFDAVKKTFFDIPTFIWQDCLFSTYFEIWKRLNLELVCKEWRRMMPYNDKCLDVIRVCRGISMDLHQNGMNLQEHSAEECLKTRGHILLMKCLQQLLIERNMGDHLKTLHFVNNVDLRHMTLTSAMATLIADCCSNLQEFRVKNVICPGEFLSTLFARLTMANLESFEVGDRTLTENDMELVDGDDILISARRLAELKLNMPCFYFSRSTSIVSVSLLQLSLSLVRFSAQEIQLLIDWLPTACPALQHIELISVMEFQRSSVIRIAPSFTHFEHLKSIRICCTLQREEAAIIADDTCEISQYFANVKRRPLESIAFTGNSFLALTDASRFHRLMKIPELTELYVSSTMITAEQLDTAFDDFCCRKMKNLEAWLIRLESEAHFLTKVGTVAGRCLERFAIYCGSDYQLSNVESWRKFIRDCRVLEVLKFVSAAPTSDVFAELGRSRSLQRIACMVPNWIEDLTVTHLRKLAEMRISEGLQQHRLTVICNDSHMEGKTFDELSAAGIEFIVGWF